MVYGDGWTDPQRNYGGNIVHCMLTRVLAPLTKLSCSFLLSLSLSVELVHFYFFFSFVYFLFTFVRLKISVLRFLVYFLFSLYLSVTPSFFSKFLYLVFIHLFSLSQSSSMPWSRW